MFKAVTFAFVVTATASAHASERPRLILQITVDQLRGDMPFWISKDRLSIGGFRWLLDNGVVYHDAHHAHANTETIVGHTTLATGAHPRDHGMVGNVWLDRGLGRTVYNIEDPDYSLLTDGGGVDAETEIDPTQKVAATDGRSPVAILSTTFSDELAVASAGEAKVFGISVKDRGAVSMAGHAGKALWFSKVAGEFVTSTYYYNSYPRWVVDWNAAGKVNAYAGKSWTLSQDQDRYKFGDRDDQEWELDFQGYGRIFPHHFGVPGRVFTTLLTFSPAGDELTADFAKTLMEAEGLGEDDVTDYLGVSFSSTDYIGHVFGPSSLEGEDNLIRLDATIAGLLEHVDRTVGLDRTLVVLSADHGAPDAPGFVKQFKVDAGYIDPSIWDRQSAIARLKQEFGIGEQLLKGYDHPYLNLNHDAINAAGLDLAKVRRAVAEEVAAFQGVHAAISSSDLVDGNVPVNEITRLILNNHNSLRSGDIYLVTDPGWFISDFDGLDVTVTHGSPWRYDTHVPIIFAGSGIQRASIYRPVETVQIAPTLSAFIDIKRPSAAWAPILCEVLHGAECGGR